MAACGQLANGIFDLTTFCAHPGCIAALSAGNLSGVCRDHMHCDVCRCAMCRRPRSKAGKRVRVRWRVKSRGELVAEGLLLPGMDDTDKTQSAKGN